MGRVVALTCLVVLGACAPSHSTSTDGRATVVRVVDGDTLVARIAGRDENVRLLGIDTPETHKPDTPVECFGREAADRLHALLPDGTVVRLVRDVESRDRYGRLLAYVYRDADGLFVDLAMVSDGYAGTLSIPPNNAHKPEFDAAVTAAQIAGVGLWRTCGGNHVPAAG